MTKTEMIEALVSHYAGGNKSRFANMLGIRAQTINTWMSRNSFDIELIYSKCEGVSAKWLLSGEGDMLENPSLCDTYSDSKNNELFSLCKNIVANYQQRDEMMNKLVSMFNTSK